MNRYLLHTLAAGLLMAGPAWAADDPDDLIDEAFPDVVPFDLDTEPVEVPMPVSLYLRGVFVPGINVHELAALTEQDIADADRRAEEKYGHIRPGPARVGVVRQIAPVSLSIRGDSAVRTELEDGGTVWTVAVASPGAFGIRLHLTGFDVGDGRVLVYAQGPEGPVVRGPYTGRGPERDGDFWTESLPGDKVFIEVAGTENPALEITELIHFDQELMASALNTRSGPPLLDCHLDVTCSTNVNWSAEMATGQMNFTDGVDGFVCTGTLLNDNDSLTVAPYFITARHCLHTQAMVDTLEVVWKYQTSVCDDETTVPNWWNLPRNVGGIHLKSYAENDMEFMWLRGELAGGLGLAGWTEATSGGDYGVHHPKGSWKRVVYLSSPTVGCPSFDPTDYDSYDQDDGLTQKGSSGSGVFNWSGQLSGQLWGICSATTDPDDLSCSNIGNFWAVYGEFDTTHDEIGWYLNIGGTLYVDGSYTGPWEFGTEANPFKAVGGALSIAWDGLQIRIAPGAYNELLTIDQEVTLLANGGTVTIGG